jgi:hypothetical protein
MLTPTATRRLLAGFGDPGIAHPVRSVDRAPARPGRLARWWRRWRGEVGSVAEPPTVVRHPSGRRSWSCPAPGSANGGFRADTDNDVCRGLRREVAVTGSREDFLSWHGDRLAQGRGNGHHDLDAWLYRALGPRRATSRIRLTASGAAGSSVNDRTIVRMRTRSPKSTAVALPAQAWSEPETSQVSGPGACCRACRSPGGAGTSRSSLAGNPGTPSAPSRECAD